MARPKKDPGKSVSVYLDAKRLAFLGDDPKKSLVALIDQAMAKDEVPTYVQTNPVPSNQELAKSLDIPKAIEAAGRRGLVIG